MLASRASNPGSNPGGSAFTRGNMKLLRSPIVVVLGHVDHGKTTILDAIRKSKVAEKESGKITQMIGASYIDKETINRIGKDIAKLMKLEFQIPGLLFIDTPGHEAFTSLRERGGSIADIAVLVVDIKQGFQNQTIEALRILKQYKVPFVVAANKIDTISGWKSSNEKSVLKSLGMQNERTKALLDEYVYNIVMDLGKENIDSERFDRVSDFTKSIAIVPVSAKTKEGLAEMLILLAGLSQKYLKEKLYIDDKEKAKGTILEVKEEKGLGTTMDVIVYEGVLKSNDHIYFIKKEGVAKTKIRALLQPNISSNNPKEKYRKIEKAVAAAGVKIMAPDLEGAIPGSPFSASNLSKKDLEGILSKAVFESEEEGVIVKADSLGSVEAIIDLFKKNNIPIHKTDIGQVNKEDVVLAKSMQKSFAYSCIIAFNVKVSKDAEEFARTEKVKIIKSDVIYKLEEDYKEWIKKKREEDKKAALTKISFPAKIKAIPGFFFRINKPAIFGIEVLEGTLKPGVSFMKEDGEVIGELKSIQNKGESLKEAKKGEKIAISVDGITLKKDIQEGDKLYVFLNDEEIEFWKEKKELLSEDEMKLVEAVEKIKIKRKIREKMK